MKPTTSLVSVLTVLATITIPTLPSFAQATTSIPITGSVTAVSSPTAGVSITSASVLSSVGTVLITGGSVSGVSDSFGNPIPAISVNSTGIITGTTSGSVAFTDGRSSNFSNANTSLNATITSISGGGQLLLATPPLTATTISGTVDTGSFISVPNSSITSSPTVSSLPPNSSITGSSTVSFLPIFFGTSGSTTLTKVISFSNTATSGDEVVFVQPRSGNRSRRSRNSRNGRGPKGSRSSLNGSPIMFGLSIYN